MFGQGVRTSMALLVVVQSVQDVSALVGWTWQIARAHTEGMCVLHVTPGVDSPPAEYDAEGLEAATDPIVAAIAEYTAAARAESASPEMSAVVIRSVTASDALRAIAREVDRLNPTLLVIGARWGADGEGERPLVRRVFDLIPCTVMAVVGEPSEPPRSILLPTAGGPHAAVAMRIMARTARDSDGTVTAMFVESPGMDDAEAVGDRILERALAEAGVSTGAHLRTRVELEASPVAGILKSAGSHDAVVVGASNQGVIYRFLFGSLPGRITREQHTMVAIVRSAVPWASRVRAAVDRALAVWVPQMSREARVDLYERLQTGSRWGFDFMALISLSTSIAALGLLQSSAAVVIGAMLVAPLMTPLLGAGLALVQGNQVLFRNAVRAVVFGFVLALSLAMLVGLLSPGKVLTAEMAARGGPTLLDLLVALLSGVAAAYASSRPHLLAALPGVAIAAALVPPIATVGLSLAFGEFAVARGAALLFATNVVAIVLGAAFALWVSGVRGRGQRSWAQRTIIVLTLALFLMMVPLASYLVELSGRAPRNLTDEVRAVAAEHGYRFTHLERRDDAIEVHLQGPALPDEPFTQHLREVAWERFGEPVPVRIITQLAVDAR